MNNNDVTPAQESLPLGIEVPRKGNVCAVKYGGQHG